MIQNVSEYKFLGSLIKSNGNFNHSLEDLVKKAQKVLFSIKSRVDSLGNIPIKVSNNLFYKLVQPLTKDLHYQCGAELDIKLTVSL
jgi:hypothetical protein